MNQFDDLFDDDYGYEPEETSYEEEQSDSSQQLQQEEHSEEDLIGDLLRKQGISDPTKIKFEGDDGIIKERDWDELSYDEQLNILIGDNQSNPETDLDDDEIDIINAIRSSKLSPTEYMQTVRDQAINDYQQNHSGNYQQPERYSVDDYTDDELFLYDMQARMPDMTDEELTEALENAKANESVFKKQVNGIRNEYKQLENNKIQQEELVAKQQYQDQYNQYANTIINSIDECSDIAGIFELEDEDKQDIAYGILGQDQAGLNNLSKILNDPNTLVRMIWFALKGEDAINSLNEYYKDQISKARQSGYQRGLSERTDSKVIKKPKSKLTNKTYRTIDDLD